MTQRIFDIENEKDMQDLWDILPDEVYCIEKAKENYEHDSIYLKNIGVAWGKTLLKINWHDKTEITRSVDYEKMIGCVGWFWDDEQDKEHKRLGILTGMEEGYFCDERVTRWVNFSPAKKSELKFWGE